MNKQIDFGLKSKLKAFAGKFSINNNEDESILFEYFSNYIVISNILKEDFGEPTAISTGKAKGIDGIGIIVNNQVIKDESELDKILEKEKIKISLSFIQSTTTSSFDLKKIQSFTDEVVNFLNGSTTIEPFSDIIKKYSTRKEDLLNK